MPHPARAARPTPRPNKVALAISSRIELYVQWAGIAFWGFLTVVALATFLGVKLH